MLENDQNRTGSVFGQNVIYLKPTWIQLKLNFFSEQPGDGITVCLLVNYQSNYLWKKEYLVWIFHLFQLFLWSAARGQVDFALLKSEYGCPDIIDQEWKTGYVEFRSSGSRFNWTTGSHVSGLMSHTHVKLAFCVGESSSLQPLTGGHYYIFQASLTCPTGKHSSHFIRHFQNIITNLQWWIKGGDL